VTISKQELRAKIFKHFGINYGEAKQKLDFLVKAFKYSALV
jgi:aspartyl-tRNA synthetase